MNAIGIYSTSAWNGRSVGFACKTNTKESCVFRMVGFSNPNQGTIEDDSKEKKTPNLGTIKVGQEFPPKAEESIRQSEQEKTVFASRVQNQPVEESEEDKALREKQWEYLKRFPAMTLTDADKKRIFNNRQICLDSDGTSTLTEKQIAFLKDRYDMRHLTEEDAYYFLCDLTEMNILSSEDCEYLMYKEIETTIGDIGKLQYATERGLWGWMWDEESGQHILVNTNIFYNEEDEPEDPEVIKARIKGYTDDMLLAAFCPEDKKEAPSLEEIQSEQAWKGNAEGITGELDAFLSSREIMTEQEYRDGGFLLDVGMRRWNVSEEINGITKAAYQDPAAADRMVKAYKKHLDAYDRFLKIADQVKR